jgi:hypothetical protein
VDAGGVPYDAGTLPPDYEGYSLHFDGAELTVTSPSGDSIATYPAVSGKPGSEASFQNQEDVGPIPEGTWQFEPSDFLVGGPGGIGSLADWGQYAVDLRPANVTDTFGRDKFLIHGGIERGSGGCIDVGPNDKALYDTLKNVSGPVYVTVRYDNPNAF